MIAELEFDASTHTYSVDGRAYTSVTQVISRVVPRQFEPGEWYMERGRALHAAINLQAQGVLDWNSVDEQIRPRLDALQKFLIENHATIKRSEIQLVSEKMQFAGTIDAQLIMSEGYVLTDFKSSIEPSVELQLGGYSLLWGESLGPKPHKALALELKDNGNYSCHWLSKLALRRSECLFKAALSIHGWMQHNKIGGSK